MIPPKAKYTNKDEDKLFGSMIADPLGAFNPSFAIRNWLNEIEQSSSHDAPFSSHEYHKQSHAIKERIVCDYCGQQNKIENFDGGCKNCGAPAPRR